MEMDCVQVTLMTRRTLTGNWREDREGFVSILGIKRDISITTAY